MTKGTALLRRRTRGKAAGGGRSDPSKWVIFAIVSIALFVMSVDVTIVSTGLQTTSFTVLALILAAIVPLALIIPDGARARRNPRGGRALSASAGTAPAGLPLNARSEPAGGS